MTQCGGAGIGTSNKDSDEDYDYLFPSLNTIFGIHKNAMRMSLLEINCLKRKDKSFIFNHKGYECLIGICDANVETTLI